MLGWNPINVLDGEGPWFAYELFLLCGMVVLTKTIEYVCTKISSRLKTVFAKIIVAAIPMPCLAFLWFYVVLHSFDVVTDQFLSYSHPALFTGILHLGGVCMVGLFLFRLKHGILQYAALSNKEGVDATSLHVLSKFLTVISLIVIGLALCDILHINITALLAVGGVGGLAIAIASQEVVANFFGGLTVHVTRPFVLGDWIQVPSHSIDGIVEEIGWYQTCLQSQERGALYVPNALFIKAVLINKSRLSYRLFEERLYLRIVTERLPALMVALTEYIQSHGSIVPQQPSGARIVAMGAQIELAVFGVVKPMSRQQFFGISDELRVRLASIVQAHDGEMLRKWTIEMVHQE